MPERISSNSGPPPLYSQPMLFWLANMISSKVIKGNPSLQEILQIVPQEGRNHRILSFADDLKDHPVFPMWTKTGSEHNARSSSSVSQHISDWAKRAGFVNGIGGLHSARREALVKANGKRIALYHFHSMLILLQGIMVNRSSSSNCLRTIETHQFFKGTIWVQ